MKNEYKIRMAVFAIFIAMALLFGESCLGNGETKTVLEIPVSSPVIMETESLETESAEIETCFETASDPSEKDTEDVYNEPAYECEEEPVYEEDSYYEPSEEDSEEYTEEEIEEDAEETEEHAEEETEMEEHECDCFYEEYYTEQPGWPCYAHECVECGHIEFFEYAEDEEEPEEEEITK